MGGLRYTRFTAGGWWNAVGKIADTSSSRLAVGPDGTVVVLFASGKLSRTVRLP